MPNKSLFIDLCDKLIHSDKLCRPIYCCVISTHNGIFVFGLSLGASLYFHNCYRLYKFLKCLI